jgi:pyrroloquinoline quinone biosynthesis protein B
LAWAGDTRVHSRTQASLAVTADGENWLLINASPDLPQQVRQSKALHPRSGTRGSPIKAVLLTGAEIDQVAGLLSLREREPFTVYATAVTLAALADNAMFGVLGARRGHAGGRRSRCPAYVSRRIAGATVYGAGQGAALSRR